MNLSHLAAAGVLALVVGAALPSVAAATDYCVTPNLNCGANNVDSFQNALDQAASATDSDRIFLGADTYVPEPGHAGFFYSAWNAPVEIVGSGRGQTVLTGPEFAVGRVLHLGAGPGSSVHDLTIRIPRNAALSFKGLSTINTAQRIDVTEDTVQVHANYGAIISEGGVLEDSSVTLESAENSTGVALGESNQGPPATLRRSVVRAATGVRIDGPGAVERSRVIGKNSGVVAAGDHIAISNSFLTINGTFGTVLRATTATNRDTNVTADGLTIFGSYLPDIGGVTVSTGPDPSRNVHLALTNSIVRGGFTPLSTVAGGGGTGTISASYSDYDPSGNVVWGGGISESNVSNVGDAAFDEATGHEFELLPGSALLDRGDPASPQGLDLNGSARVADGDGDGVARRDLGALELQPPALSDPSAGGAPGGGSGADTQAPLVSDFRTTPSVFALARARTPLAARVPRGTRLRYALSENARVTLKIQRVRAGRPARYRTVGTLRRAGIAGPNSTRFSGRIGRRALRPGRYRAMIAATDTAGNRSARRTTRFRITRG